MINFEVKDIYTTLTELNIRQGPSTSASMVPYERLTQDAKNKSINSVLNINVRVSCIELRAFPNAQELWIRIPSGWICAIKGTDIYIK